MSRDSRELDPFVPQVFARLDAARHVLLCGAGGGFDVYSALPLGTALTRLGKQVSYCNLSFTYFGGTDAPQVAPHLYRVTPEVEGEERYFPERSLARWLRSRSLPAVVWAFEKVGVEPLSAAYRAVLERVDADALVLVDGGTDLLMTGDEAGLGTPQEDMTSLCAVKTLPLDTKLVACIGFGVDAHHGVCHAHFLENVAVLEHDGGFLGAFSVMRSSPEGQAFLDAVAAANAETPGRSSIVNNSIAAAMRGDSGDAHLTSRTGSSELFISPMMAMYFTFELDAVARRNKYLDTLMGTRSAFDVSARIEAFRCEVRARPRRFIPH